MNTLTNNKSLIGGVDMTIIRRYGKLIYEFTTCGDGLIHGFINGFQDCNYHSWKEVRYSHGFLWQSDTSRKYIG